MKAHYKTKDGRLTFEIDATDIKGVWKQCAAIQEVFEEPKCQKCGKDNLRFTIRKSTDGKKEYEYHELKCLSCGAKLPYGVLDDGSGGLFPKRKDKEKNWKGKYGWVKWNPEKEVEE